MASVEPWVGTWRPHRPRGPISAMYGSPGPKYLLPGLTGLSKHDPTKQRAPMFSFGAQHKWRSLDSSPGPKYLIPSNMTRAGRGCSPAFSLSGRPKELESSRGPGPGQYSPERSGKFTFRSGPAYTLSGRTNDLSRNQTPGPAAYTLPSYVGQHTVAVSTAPAYSLCSRRKAGSFYEDLKKTPGPAAYKAVDPRAYRERAPQFSMTGRNFAPGETTQKPGPGAHYPENVTITRAKPPSFTFGLRHSQFISPLIIEQDEA